MIRAFFLLGLVLVAGGAYGIYAGAGYIVLERGWSMVIAGSVFSAAGFVVLAAAALMGEVRRGFKASREAIEGLQNQYSPAREKLVSAFPDLRPARPMAPLPDPVAPGEEPDAAPRLDDRTQPSLFDAPPLRPALDPFVAEEARPARPEREASVEHREERAALAGTVAGLAVVEAPAPPREEATAHAVADPYLPAEPHPVPPAHDVTSSPLPSVPAEADIVRAEPSMEEAALQEPPPDRPGSAEVPAPDMPSPEDVPTVVGTYASGGHTYVMYSDGSIEAETPDGLYRFTSLDELKDFIARGEMPPKVETPAA